MPIIETRISRRPNTSVLFFNDSPNAVITYNLIKADLFDTGKVSKAKTYSDDELTETLVHTFVDLAAIDEFYNLTQTLTNGAELATYFSTTGIEFLGYTQTGIDQPFTVTSEYTFTSVEDVFAEVNLVNAQFPSAGMDIQAVIEVLSLGSTLTSLTVEGTKVIAVHTYQDSTEYSTYKYNDNSMAADLIGKNATKSMAFALV